jgi:hypothetical protein
MTEGSRSSTAGGLLALLLPSFTRGDPGMGRGLDVRDELEIVFLPLVFVAMWASRPPVDRYLASLETPPRVWEGLVQLTPGCFGFHSRRLHLCEVLLGRIS